jgi:hypothetical protein
MSTISQTYKVALQNKSSKKIKFTDLVNLTLALQIQVDRDLFPIWGIRAQLFPLNDKEKVPDGVWPIYFIDPDDEPDHQGLGVHLNEKGNPSAFVTDEGDWTITASHELLEILVDPHGHTTKDGPDIDPNSDRHSVSYLVEVGDPCEIYWYTINNIKVSDFVTRNYYNALAAGPYDYLNRLSKPFEVPLGCYISWQDMQDRRWHQKKTNGEFVTGDPIDLNKNPREDRDKSFGEDEEKSRHNLFKILNSQLQITSTR